MSHKRLIGAILLIFPLILFGQDTIEKIEISGNVRVPGQTILHYLYMKEGKTFDKTMLQKDFEALWSTGFFSDIKIEERQGEQGKILKITVEENPFIARITYESGKNLKKKEIIAWLKERGLYISPYSFTSASQIQRTKKSIEELLLDQGFHSGDVDIVMDEQENNTHDMLILVNPGKRIRLGKIVFEGDLKLPENILRAAMQENKEHSIESWLMGKDIFKRNRLDEDLASIKRELQEHGYMNAAVGDPKIEDITKRTIFPKTMVMKKITIPVQAGNQYFVGSVDLEGNEVLSTENLKKLITLKKGEIYSIKTRDSSVENIRALYLKNGYLYSQITPFESLDHETKQAHVRFSIFEGEVAYLSKLEFRGNSFVKDKIMRKKMLISEQDVFNFQLFERSLFRISQLGIVRLGKEPEITPHPEDPSQVDVALDIKENLRNNYGFSAGYSGGGSFSLALDYAVINLLGTGEIIHLTFEKGRKIKDYQHDISAPYLLDYPVNFAFHAYYRDNIFPNLFNKQAIGANITTGTRINGYWRTNLTYGYEKVNTTLPDDQGEGEDGFDPVYLTLFGLGEYEISSVIFSIFHTNLEIPSFPYRRNYFSASCKFTGGILGGDISLYKPRIVWSYFHPLFRNHKAGFYIDYQFVEELRYTEIPFWERIYLGGDRSIRGYDVYSIGPTSEQGTNIGGEEAIVFNAEYLLPVYEPLYAVLFYDIGNTYGADQNFNIKDMYSSTGIEFRISDIELRIFYIIIPLPIRIIFAYNNRKIDPGDSRFSIRFTIATYH